MHKLVKFLHISDVHLGATFSDDTIIGRDSEKRRQELWKTFQKTLDFAVNQNVNFVLIAGDLFENASFTISNLDRLAYIFHQFSQLKFFIVGGNHDYLSNKLEYLKETVGDNVHIFGSELSFKEISELGIRVYGYTWDSVEISEIPFTFFDLNSDYYNILLLHSDGRTPSNHLPLDINVLEKIGFDYCALGHIHYNHSIGNNIYYSGSPEPMKFTNKGPHGALLVTGDGLGNKVEFIEFGTREYREFSVNLDDISDNFKAFQLLDSLLEPAGRGDYIRISFIGQKYSGLDMDEIFDRLTERYNYIQFIDSTTSEMDFEDIFEKNRTNLVGEFMEYVQENFNKEMSDKLISVCLRGLAAGEKR